MQHKVCGLFLWSEWSNSIVQAFQTRGNLFIIDSSSTFPAVIQISLLIRMQGAQSSSTVFFYSRHYTSIRPNFSFSSQMNPAGRRDGFHPRSRKEPLIFGDMLQQAVRLDAIKRFSVHNLKIDKSYTCKPSVDSLF